MHLRYCFYAGCWFLLSVLLMPALYLFLRSCLQVCTHHAHGLEIKFKFKMIHHVAKLCCVKLI